MLDTSAKNMLVEIRAAEKLRDTHLASLDNQLARFVGPTWDKEYKWSDLDYDPKNRAFQYIAQTLPHIAYDNPRFSVKSRRGDAQQAVAEAMRHGMNRWAIDTQVEIVAEQVATDAQFTYGVIVVAQVPSGLTDPGTKEPAFRPQMMRRSPKEFGMDPIAKDVKDARFMFDLWVSDKEDLVKRAKDNPEEGWDADAIENLTGDTGLDKLTRPSDSMLNRDEIVGYSIWVPEEELPFGDAEKKKYKAKDWKSAGFNGVIRTVAVGQANNALEEGMEIRKPQPYYGPPSGPYQLIGMGYVPDSAYPLGPLTAAEAQNQELNSHARAYLRSASRRKTLGIVGANDALLTQAVKNAEDGDVVTANVADIAKNYVKAEFDGPTEIQRLCIMDLENDLDNALGTSDSLRGAVTGVGTATENSIAAQSSGSRLDWNRKKFRRQFNAACNKVAWFLYHDDRVAFPVGGAEVPGPGEPWFKGGTQGEGTGYTFEDLELDIEAESMARQDEAQRQAKTLQAVQMVTAWFPMMVQFPGAGWSKLVDAIGDAFEVPGLEEMVNIQGVIQSGLAMMALQAGQQPPAGGQSMPPPKPMLAGDAGLPRMFGGATGNGGKMAPSANPKAAGGKKMQLAGAA